MSEKIDLLIVGSTGIDTIETPSARGDRLLGGSASYACAAASYFCRPGMVGAVGTDFPAAYHDLYADLGVDTEGLQIKEGKTFFWAGRYLENMDERETLQTDLNVFADFMPDLPAAYLETPYVFLANIAPALQLHVLDQVSSPRFVVADTMNLWINTAREDLMRLLGRIDMITLNESEAQLLTDCRNLYRAADKLMSYGPRFVLIKKGEHGCIFKSNHDIFILPAYPLTDITDPTGAGDAFAGAMMGCIAGRGALDFPTLKRAFLYGTVIASFTIEAFGLERIAALTRDEIEARAAEYEKMLSLA